MIKNVYGTILLTVSRETAASSKGLAILDSYYAISDDRVGLTELTQLHKNGRVLETVKVHNVKISWDRFLAGGSYE
ncbi:hypothetical protein OZL92_16655 [Bacillus sonorensis]|uniref:Uncharacterized protein n=1 Tax=Bacillus sonorensis L12 TaxID=1274524 RepID=M5NZ85_9BACI|nr:hypothetical protein [Bacillus sonorensis]EME72519.1 hypothetical protein BSONL12_21474 [Bacillus sonorensis L12]MCZ0075298.1 hypothetical protein [Bacillus sonorensis]MCZ0092974.1 hypothetical protein [Bacillus sonorensis]PAD57763.1 hypothetical protein CHH92_23445 [Bacillus sonorensis]